MIFKKLFVAVSCLAMYGSTTSCDPEMFYDYGVMWTATDRSTNTYYFDYLTDTSHLKNEHINISDRPFTGHYAQMEFGRHILTEGENTPDVSPDSLLQKIVVKDRAGVVFFTETNSAPAYFFNPDNWTQSYERNVYFGGFETVRSCLVYSFTFNIDSLLAATADRNGN